MKKHLSVRYGTIQGCYWMGYAALMGYASVYLLEKGFTNTQIGLLTAVGCIVSAVLQPALASYADRPEAVRTNNAPWSEPDSVCSCHFPCCNGRKQFYGGKDTAVRRKHYDADADDSVR